MLAWRKSIQIYINFRFKELAGQNIAEQIKDKVGFDSGVGLYRGRLLRHYVPAEKGPAFLLGYILRAGVDEPTTVIDMLVDSGIAVSYADLVEVTKLKVPVAKLNKLLLSSNLRAAL
jgi:hypothetical protein